MSDGFSSEEAVTEPHRVIARFWPRVGAFAIDCAIVGAVGFVLGLFLFDPFSRIGAWGRLIGFCLALPYFGLLNSAIGGGQTVGKRAVKLQVVDFWGNTISLSRSCVRYAIFAIPFFLNQLGVSPSRTIGFVGFMLNILIFGLGGGIIYLFICNRRTRQSLHDLAAGTFVVDAEPKGALVAPPVWKGHWAVLLALLAWSFATASVIGRKLANTWRFPEMLRDIDEIAKVDGVQSVRMLMGKNWAPGRSTNFIQADVRWQGRPKDLDAAEFAVATRLFQCDPKISDADFLRITIVYGFDIGIASAWRSYSLSDTPQNWQKKLGAAGSSKQPPAQH